MSAGVQQQLLGTADFRHAALRWPGAGSNRRPSDFQSDARTNSATWPVVAHFATTSHEDRPSPGRLRTCAPSRSTLCSPAFTRTLRSAAWGRTFTSSPRRSSTSPASRSTPAVTSPIGPRSGTSSTGRANCRWRAYGPPVASMRRPSAGTTGSSTCVHAGRRRTPSTATLSSLRPTQPDPVGAECRRGRQLLPVAALRR